jgi:hypothetical protein
LTDLRRASTVEPVAAKAAGQHIPAPPTAADMLPAVEAAAPAPDYVFEPAGAVPVTAAVEIAAAAAPAPLAEGEEIVWSEENATLGVRIAVVKTSGDTVTTHEEVVPYGTSSEKIAATKARLSRKVLPAS